MSYLRREIAIFLLCIITVTLFLVTPKVIIYVKNFVGKGEKIRIVRYFPFSKENDLKEWEEKIFKGKVLYRIARGDHESFVLASSDKTASALYYKVKLDMKQRPIISWKWNAQRFPYKDKPEDIRDMKQDDFAARVYVIFPSFFFTSSKALEYIWAENLPAESIFASPYSKNLQLIVAETGKKDDSFVWIDETRDICADYIKAFGEEPKLNIGAIAFMTDADSTGSSAESFYDEIKIGYK